MIQFCPYRNRPHLASSTCVVSCRINRVRPYRKVCLTNYSKVELSANICLWLASLMTLALTMQRYRIRRRIFDTLLKRRTYHRFRASQFSGVILICFLGGGTPRGRRKPFARDGLPACLSDGQKAPAKASWTSTVRKLRRCLSTGPSRSSSRSATILRLSTSQTG